MELLSQSQWAERCGFSRQYAHQLVKNGTVKLIQGKINPEQAETALAALRQPSHSLRRSNSETILEEGKLSTLLLKTRIKNEVERGRLLEAKAKTELGKLVDADEVRVAAFNKARVIRDGLLNIPDRVASVLASISDSHQVHDILTKEIRLVLEELSRE